ncbi:MAG: glutamate--cysteine ligase [Gammaproteobacteria bacterium]|nr:glutamate--cysteine ligase [Gammaproteobacteria bacterium]
MGLEKESLRVTSAGKLAMTPHPPGLGSALSHPWITTDYSEALLELVTPPLREPWEVLQFLVDLHQYVYEKIDDEMLWVTSMPCSVRSDKDIPIAWYGHSNVGMMKHVYRRGLGYRYGRLMQAISGIHYNYSVGSRFWEQLLGDKAGDSSLVSAEYFGLLRNFRRYGWLLLYLFGASPALCRGFVGDNETDLEEFESTLFGTYATSLRMSDLGYKNKVQSRLEIAVNDIDDYITALAAATDTPYPPYEEIGVVVDGEYRQLNANMLQIENEYYSLIRPKRVARSGEKPTHALRRGGVEYVEVRACDVSPFDPVGISQAQVRFIEVLLLFCLLHDSPPIDEDEQARINHNQLQVARRGRDPALRLQRYFGEVPVADYGLEIGEQMMHVAEFCDAGNGTDYRDAVSQQLDALRDPELTRSARVLREMRDKEQSFFEFALGNSRCFDDYFQSLVGLSEARRQQLDGLSEDSIMQQRQIEDSDAIPFDLFLERYFAQ